MVKLKLNRMKNEFKLYIKMYGGDFSKKKTFLSRIPVLESKKHNKLCQIMKDLENLNFDEQVLLIKDLRDGNLIF